MMIPETILNIGLVLIGKKSYLIGKFKIGRDEYWSLNDEERQFIHDTHDDGSKAMTFDKTSCKQYKNL